MYCGASRVAKEQAWLYRYPPKIPYIIDFKLLLTTPPEQELMDFIEAKLADENILNKKSDWSKIVLLVDGFEVLTTTQATQFLQRAEILTEQYRGLKIIITSRPGSNNLRYERIAACCFTYLELEPFDEFKSIELIRRLVPQQEDDFQSLSFFEWLEDLDYNPFLITTATLDADQNNSPDDLRLTSIIKRWIDKLTIEFYTTTDGELQEELQEQTTKILTKIAFQIYDSKSLNAISKEDILGLIKSEPGVQCQERSFSGNRLRVFF